MALVTQAEAIRRLRAEVPGRRVEWCIDKARELATTKDGSRMKINAHDLDTLIRKENAPPKKKDLGLRPLTLRNA